MKYVSSLSDNTYSKVRASNRSLVKKFLAYLKSIKRAKRTITFYNNNLKLFFIWNLNHNDNKDFTKITKEDFKAFQDTALHDWQWGLHCMVNEEATISSLSNFVQEHCQDDERYAGYRNIIKYVRISKAELTATTSKPKYAAHDLDKMLDTLIEVEHFKEACAVALVMYSGMPKKYALKVGADVFSEKAIYRDIFYKIKVNDKWFYVIKDKFDSYLESWMKQREQYHITSKWLFPAVEDISRSMVQRSFEDAMRKAVGETEFCMNWSSISWYSAIEFEKLDLPYDILHEMAGIDKKDMIAMYISGRKEKQK